MWWETCRDRCYGSWGAFGNFTGQSQHGEGITACWNQSKKLPTVMRRFNYAAPAVAVKDYRGGALHATKQGWNYDYKFFLKTFFRKIRGIYALAAFTPSRHLRSLLGPNQFDWEFGERTLTYSLRSRTANGSVFVTQSVAFGLDFVLACSWN